MRSIEFFFNCAGGFFRLENVNEKLTPSLPAHFRSPESLPAWLLLKEVGAVSDLGRMRFDTFHSSADLGAFGNHYLFCFSVQSSSQWSRIHLLLRACPGGHIIPELLDGLQQNISCSLKRKQRKKERKKN